LIDILIEDVFNNSNRSFHESVEYLNYVASQIIKNGRFTGYELKRCLHDYCISIRICPQCGSEITTRTIPGDRSECRGFPVTEYWNEWYCDECDWVDDKE
jgi:exosome complex RNA-binding protein Csl4